MQKRTNHEPDGKKHVLFFTPSLGKGGAEMHVLRLLNHLDRNQFRLSVALAQGGETYESVLEEDVAVHPLNPPGINSSTLRMLRAIAPLRQLILTEQPDILCAFQDHANLAAMWACRNLSDRPKVLLGVQNNVSARYHRRWNPLHRLMRLQMRTLYPRADKIIALSQGVAMDLATIIPQVLPLTEVIYNAGVDNKVLNGAKEVPGEIMRPQNAPLIVACGRLHPQKGYSYLLNAIRHVRDVMPVNLWILGEGPERAALEAQIRKLELTDCVRLAGFQKNPYQYMAAADVFVLSSLYEGFANVVAEAMACAAPVIATDCPYGPGEIIEDGISGMLVPPANADTLAQTILQVLSSPELQQNLSGNGKLRSQDFHAKSISTSYANLFQQVCYQ